MYATSWWKIMSPGEERREENGCLLPTLLKWRKIISEEKKRKWKESGEAEGKGEEKKSQLCLCLPYYKQHACWGMAACACVCNSSCVASPDLPPYLSLPCPSHPAHLSLSPLSCLCMIMPPYSSYSCVPLFLYAAAPPCLAPCRHWQTLLPACACL